MAVKGIKAGSEILADAIAKGSNVAVEKLPQRETPIHVSDTTLTTLNGARMMSKSAVMISATMAKTVRSPPQRHGGHKDNPHMHGRRDVEDRGPSLWT